MKRPYLNEYERLLIKLETVKGGFLMLELRKKQLYRELEKTYLIKSMIKIVTKLSTILN